MIQPITYLKIQCLSKLFAQPLPPVTLRYGSPPSPVGTAYFNRLHRRESQDG